MVQNCCYAVGDQFAVGVMARGEKKDDVTGDFLRAMPRPEAREFARACARLPGMMSCEVIRWVMPATSQPPSMPGRPALTHDAAIFVDGLSEPTKERVYALLKLF